MHLKAIIIVFTLLVIVGCSSMHKRKVEPSAFVPVHTIELRDATNPVLLSSTGAKRIREFIQIGLTGQGYAVCSDCKSDAVATVTVYDYSTYQDSKRDWLGWGTKSYVETGNADWSITVVRNGEQIFQKRIYWHDTKPVDQIAGQQVQEVLEQIPAHQ